LPSQKLRAKFQYGPKDDDLAEILHHDDPQLSLKAL